jgi:hypothetical protein
VRKESKKELFKQLVSSSRFGYPNLAHIFFAKDSKKRIHYIHTALQIVALRSFGDSGTA